MNKFRKAESRKVKILCRAYRVMGYDFSYRSVRRKIRKFDRAMRDFSKNFRRGLHKGIKRCDYGVARAVTRIAEYAIVAGRAHRAPVGISAVAESLALLQKALTEQKLSVDKPKCTGLETNYIFLDESTSMEATPALWPKENPYIPKEVPQ